MVNGRLQWIMDGFTTSSDYPMSDLVDLSQGDQRLADPGAGRCGSALGPDQLHPELGEDHRRRVLRSPVKIDAWDAPDPILQTWMRAFPGVVLPKADISRLDGLAPALSGGPVQGAASGLVDVPRDARRRSSTTGRRTGGCRRTRRTTIQQPVAAAVLYDASKLPNQPRPSSR